jgi:hypothetical protein
MKTLSEITKNHRRQYGKAPSGFVVYRGPSQIDGQPIVAVAIMSSNNDKTDDMPQVFIIRADIPPLVALKTGAMTGRYAAIVWRGPRIRAGAT